MIKLSIAMITYNHEQYIAQALDSVLSQVTDFDFEIVIGEDCSTDSTRSILLDYKERYPEKFKLLLPDENIGMIRNFAKTIKKCSGEYIAILEGDDYFSSPYKLQKQVDLLEKNKNLSGCFHNVIVEYELDNNKNHLYYNRVMKSQYTQKDFSSGNFVHTCSVVFRSGLFEDFPEWYMDMPMGDWPLHLLNTGRGSYGYIDEVMSVYRVHGGGMWSCVDRKKILERSISAANYLVDNFQNKYKKITTRASNKWKFELFLLENDERGIMNSFIFIFKLFIIESYDFVLFRKSFVQLVKSKINRKKSNIIKN